VKGLNTVQYFTAVVLSLYVRNQIIEKSGDSAFMISATVIIAVLNGLKP
jgi:hypothetical protein